MNEGLIITGKVDFRLVKEDGSEINWHVDNLIVNAGKYHIIDQIVDQVQAAMSHMAIGTGTGASVTPATVSDTSLETELSRLVFSSKTQGTGADANKVTYECEWSPGVGTGSIREAGIFNSASAGTMLARTTFQEKNKESGDTLSITWTVTLS